MPTRELLAGETKSSLVKHFEHLNNKNNVCKQTSLLYLDTCEGSSLRVHTEHCNISRIDTIGCREMWKTLILLCASLTGQS